MTFTELDDLNAYLASDPMVQKLRGLTEQLQELGDTVKADELAGRLKSAREDAVRHLRDRSELFDGDTISFGKHRFSVNTQDLELTMLRRDDNMVFHLTGTGYYGDVDRDDFLATQDYWDQDLISENDAVYRAEYLAWQIIDASERGVEGLDEKVLQQADFAEGELLDLVRRFAAQRYEEQYERGLHDADAVKILAGLIHLRSTCDLLRFHATARAMALLWWLHVPSPAQQKAYAAQARSFQRLRAAYGPAPEHLELSDQLGKEIAAWCAQENLPDPGLTAGNYLIEELGLSDDLVAIVSGESEDLVKAFYEQLTIKNLREVWESERQHLSGDLVSLWNLTGAWVDGFLADRGQDGHALRDEIVFQLLTGDGLARRSVHARASMEIEGLLGQHNRIQEQRMTIRIDSFFARVEHFARVTVPGWQRYREMRREVIDTERERLRLEEFKPRVLTSFVRNRLINEVYLPMIGDNFAKQMGTVGENKRTDLMGMLLLISPPGYGKTTLMEYISSVLGLTFMKINGPAIGHQVLSLDPQEAPNATARQELEKLEFKPGNGQQCSALPR